MELNSEIQETQIELDEVSINPIANFMFALKASESKRQYPKRLEIFLNFLKLDGTFEEKATAFYEKAKKKPTGYIQN